MAPTAREDGVLDNYQAVVSAFSEFLTVAVHTILYERNIYPRTSFLSARKYNYPVRQNRHPTVCKWIQDAVAAVEVELLKCTVSQTSLVIFSANSIPLERYVFSTTNFPLVPANSLLTPFVYPPEPQSPPSSASSSPSPSPQLAPETVSQAPAPPTPLIDLHSQFRAIFARLSTLIGSLSPLPPECTFTIAIELRDRPQGEPPIGWPQPWVAAQPDLQPAERQSQATEESGTSKTSDEWLRSSAEPVEARASSSGEKKPSAKKVDDEVNREPRAEAKAEAGASTESNVTHYKSQKGKFISGAQTRPVRSVEAGPFVMEFWVEEAVGKEEATREAEVVARTLADMQPKVEDESAEAEG